MDLSGKSKDELLALRADIEQRLVALEAEQLNSAREEVAAIAKRIGMPVAELLSFVAPGQKKAPKASAKGSVPPRYRDPANAANVWTGRGRKPKWVEEFLKNPANKMEDLLIKD